MQVCEFLFEWYFFPTFLEQVGEIIGLGRSLIISFDVVGFLLVS